MTADRERELRRFAKTYNQGHVTECLDALAAVTRERDEAVEARAAWEWLAAEMERDHDIHLTLTRWMDNGGGVDTRLVGRGTGGALIVLGQAKDPLAAVRAAMKAGGPT